jgi:hypothetical protein
MVLGPITRLRNRRAVKRDLADDEFMAEVAEADAACAADLAELKAIGADETFGELLMAVPPPPDEATDDMEAPEGG